MAIFHTNFLTGDDSTGDGTYSNPFKTIFKATQSITANDDEVRVAGGSWVNLSGTLTFTNNTDTVTTSVDLTSELSELGTTDNGTKVILTIDDQYGFNKTMFTVVAATSTTLTLHAPWGGETGTFNAKRLDTIHYSWTTSSITSPLGNSGAIDTVSNNVNTFTNIVISGGWTAENVQDGWTGVASFVTNRTTITNRFLEFQTGSNRASNLVFDKFIAVNLLLMINMISGSFATRNLAFIKCSGLYAASNTAVFNDANNTVSNIYSFDTSNIQAWNTFNQNSNYLISQWITSSTQNESWFITNKVIIDEIHFRAIRTTFLYNSRARVGPIVTEFSRPFTINSIYLYANVANSCLSIGNNSNAHIFINKLFILGNHVNTNTVKGFIRNFGDLNGLSYIGDGTQELDKLRWASRGVGNTDPIRAEDLSSLTIPLITSNGVFRLKSTGNGDELHNFIWGTSTTEYETGDNSLVILANVSPDGGTTKNIPIAILPKFTGAAKTLTVKLKTDNVLSGPNGSIFYRIFIEYGGGTKQINISPTTSWQDYTIVLDPSTDTNWNTYPYAPINVVCAFSTDNSILNPPRLYIDSVTLI